MEVHSTGGLPKEGLLVCNHLSYMDIITISSLGPVIFVAKSELGGWPLIGSFLRKSGTILAYRDHPIKSAQTASEIESLLRDGLTVVLFPEGTSTDGLQVLPFKSTLFQAFFAAELKDAIAVQPVTVVYHAPHGAERRFYGWWGEMTFGAHLLKTLAPARQGRVQVIYHPPLKVSDFPSRKALAQACEKVVRDGHDRLRANNGP